MHERSICHAVLELALAALGCLPPPAPRVERVTIRVGRLTAVVPESLRHHFDLLIPGTSLESAELVIEEIPIRGRCAECAAEFEFDTLSLVCPRCGSGFVELLSGRELEVFSLDTVEEVPRAG